MSEPDVLAAKITLGEQDFEIRVTQNLGSAERGDLVIDVVGNVYRLRRVEGVLNNFNLPQPIITYADVANRVVVNALERVLSGMYTKAELGDKPVLVKFGEHETFFQQPDGVRS